MPKQRGRRVDLCILLTVHCPDTQIMMFILVSIITFHEFIYRMKYYSGCSATINRFNGTIESPAYGVTGYPHNQVREYNRFLISLGLIIMAMLGLIFLA